MGILTQVINRVRQAADQRKRSIDEQYRDYVAKCAKAEHAGGSDVVPDTIAEFISANGFDINAFENDVADRVAHLRRFEIAAGFESARTARQKKSSAITAADEALKTASQNYTSSMKQLLVETAKLANAEAVAFVASAEIAIVSKRRDERLIEAGKTLVEQIDSIAARCKSIAAGAGENPLMGKPADEKTRDFFFSLYEELANGKARLQVGQMLSGLGNLAF